MTDLLATYRSKRDFLKTPEPSGEAPGAGGAIFVIQRHRARTLHYDFRIEVDGVLKSWAVPKGPPTKPGEPRLAIMTEDHPVEYAKFSGKIPKGSYGAGTVEIWDSGNYRNLRERNKGNTVNMAEALLEGKVELLLTGEKLRGAYTLIRTADGDGSRWLWIKMKDNPTGNES